MKRQFTFGMMLVAALVAALVLAPVQASAVVINYTDRGAFPANNSVDWADLGPDSTIVPSGSTVNAALFGTQVTVSQGAGTSLERRDQGSGWSGNFANGDALIWTGYGPGSLILDFSVAIWGGGAQIQQNFLEPFTGTLSAYDSALNLVGSFNLAGNSNTGGDNSAIFMGIFSSDANITRLVFSVSNDGAGLAINSFDFLQCPPAAVPVPAAVWLLGSGLVGLVGLRRKLGK